MSTTAPAALPTALAPGQRFHGLLVHSVLGEGAMGAAYLASHPVLKTPLVLKLFKLTAGRDLFQEAHLAARVRSPHTVGAIDAGIEDGVPFLVQPYVDGIDLAELLRHVAAIGRPLRAALVGRLIVDTARGLHAIHQAGVVHRDVKPANLFLRGDGVVNVGDFGIAVDPLRPFEPGVMIGTPFYMAPEQWRGEPTTRQTDLYALGATAHQLAVGAPPFQGGTSMDLGVAHVTTPYVPPLVTDPRDAYFFAVTARMLRKLPEERHPTADGVVSELAVIAERPPRWTSMSDDEAQVGKLRVRLRQGDLAACSADVIVNAANGALSMSVGVARALSVVGGDAIAEEAARYAPVPMGSVVWTGAGRLRAKHVAHAVAAIEGAACLQRAMLRVLLGAEARGARVVACPALGTGVGQAPMAMAASLLLQAVHTFASLEPQRVEIVDFVLYDAAALSAWRAILRST